MSDEPETPSRRSVLRTTAVAAGSLAVGGAGTAAGRLTASTTGAGASNKRGGRAQAEGDVRRNDPFTLSSAPSSATMGASCMSSESADQGYLGYDIQYCDTEGDEADATLYVVPDEAELLQDETYVIRSIQECKAEDGLLKVAFGPAPHGCP